jgi:hypothetical protein
MTAKILNHEAIAPVWLRVSTAVAASGVSRSRLYEWIRDGRIRSICIRERHQVKGTRLIHAASLWKFLDSMGAGDVGK